MKLVGSAVVFFVIAWLTFGLLIDLRVFVFHEVKDHVGGFAAVLAVLLTSLIYLPLWGAIAYARSLAEDVCDCRCATCNGHCRVCIEADA